MTESSSQSKSEATVERNGKKYKKWPKISKQNVRNIMTFCAVWISYFSVNASYSMLGPVFPQEAAKFGVQKFLIGFIVSVAALCVVILSPLFGYFAPQIGIKFMFVSGTFLVGGSYFLLGFIDKMSSYNELVTFAVLLRVIEGIGTAGCFTAVFIIGTNLYPNNPGTVFGTFEVSASLGFVVGPPIAGVLFELGGFILPFVATGGVLLIFVPILCILIPEIESEKQFLPLITVAKLMLNLPFILLFLCGVTVLGTFGFFIPTLAPFLSSQFHLSHFAISFVFLLAPLFYMMTSLILGRLTDKMGPRYIIIIGLFSSGVCFFFIGPAPFISDKSYLWLTSVSYAISGIGLSCAFVPVFLDMILVARNIDPEFINSPDNLTNIVSGIISSSICLGEFVGPLIGGALSEVLSFQMAEVIVGMILITKGILFLEILLVDKYLPIKKLNSR